MLSKDVQVGDSILITKDNSETGTFNSVMDVQFVCVYKDEDSCYITPNDPKYHEDFKNFTPEILEDIKEKVTPELLKQHHMDVTEDFMVYLIPFEGECKLQQQESK